MCAERFRSAAFAVLSFIQAHRLAPLREADKLSPLMIRSCGSTESARGLAFVFAFHNTHTQTHTEPVFKTATATILGSLSRAS